MVCIKLAVVDLGLGLEVAGLGLGARKRERSSFEEDEEEGEVTGLEGEALALVGGRELVEEEERVRASSLGVREGGIVRRGWEGRRRGVGKLVVTRFSVGSSLACQKKCIDGATGG